MARWTRLFACVAIVAVLVSIIVMWPTSKEERVAPPEERKPAPVASAVVAPPVEKPVVVVAPSSAPVVAIHMVATPTKVATRKANDHFVSAEACAVAMRSGEFEYYTPRFYGNRERNPADGVTKVVAPLPEAGCLLEYTAYGVFWVAQKEGDLFRFYKKADGTLEDIPYAREDCGNPVKGITYPFSKQVGGFPLVVPSSPPQVQQSPPDQVQQAPAVAVAPVPSVSSVTPPLAQMNICEENGLYGEQYSPGVTDKGVPVCFEKLPWHSWENLKTPVVIVVGVAVVYCAITGRCGFWKKGGGAGGISAGGGPVGGAPIGGPIGGGGTGGPVGGGAIP